MSYMPGLPCGETEPKNVLPGVLTRVVLIPIAAILLHDELVGFTPAKGGRGVLEVQA